MKNDNDAAYKRLRQLIKNDDSAAFDTDGPEIRLIGNLGNLTRERFAEMIEPFMDVERAQYVRKLRVDGGLTWRGIAEAWERQYASLAQWNFKGNQLAGIALCELAAPLFAEDAMEPPWN